MATSTYLQTLASYVPRFIVEDANNQTEAVKAPTVATSQAAVLFVDVSGFTALTERLAERGTGGAEDLAHILNTYFGDIINSVTDAGGDIVKFAGDALLCLWRTGDTDAELSTALHTIAAVALDLQAKLHNYQAAADVYLSMKLCISAGTIHLERLGGVFDRWELLVAGAPLAECGHANDLAEPGNVMVTPRVTTLLTGHFDHREITEGYAVLTAQSCNCAAAPTAAALTPVVPLPAAAAHLRHFIPGAIRDKLEAHQANWLNELRTISVVFVNLPEFSAEAPVGFAHRAMRRLQTSLYRFEGSINKISVDDKGASLLCVLGLPPFSHDDDPGRAVRAALVMQREMKALGLTATVGITTGRAFCGTVGNDRRREYSILGNVVNLAARLMIAAKTKGGLLSDNATYRQAKAFAIFEKLDPIQVKGRAEPMTIWRPGLVQKPKLSLVTGGKRKVIKVFGRDGELEAFDQAMSWTLQHREARSVVLEGRVGMGKSRILQVFQQRASDKHIPAFAATATTLDQDTAYAPLRQILDALFDIGIVQNKPDAPADVVDPTAEDLSHMLAADSARIVSELPDDPDIIANAPLLSRVMSIEIPDNDLTAGYSGKQRLTKIEDIVCRLLSYRLQKSPVLFLLKDVQNLDSASWGLLLRLSSLEAPLLIVVTARQEEIQDNASYQALNGNPWVERRDIGPLDREAARGLICQKLNARNVPDDVLDLLFRKSQGVPLFLEELALTLKESGEITIEDGVIYATVEMSTLDQMAFSTSLKGAIISRIDRLPPAEQMTLKVASVFGRTFEIDRLAEIHPIAEATAQVSNQCATLDQQGFTPVIKANSLLAAATDQPKYKFKSGMVQQVAYDLLLFSQRRELHAALAESLEKDMAENPEKKRNNRLLAYHLEKAADGDPDAHELRFKAAELYRQLANEAAEAYTLDSAFSLIKTALSLIGDISGAAVPAEKYAQLELDLRLLEGRLAMETGGYAAQQAEDAYNRAQQLADELGNYDDLFFAMRGLWQLLVGQSNYAKAQSLGRPILAIAHASENSGYVLEAHRIIGSAHFWSGEFRAARYWMDKTAELFDPEVHGGLSRVFGQDTDIANRGFLAWVLALTDEPDAAMSSVTALLDRADRLNHPFTDAYAHGMAMWAGYWLRDPSLTHEQATLLKNLGEERGFVYLAVAADVARHWGLAAATTVRDERLQFAESAEKLITEWRDGGNSIGVTFFLTVLMDIWLLAGRPEETLRVSKDSLFAENAESEKWYKAHQLALTLEALQESGADAPLIAEVTDETFLLAKKQGAKVVLKRVAERGATTDNNAASN